MKPMRVFLAVGLVCLLMATPVSAAVPQDRLSEFSFQEGNPPSTGGETVPATEPDAFDSIEEVLGTLGVFAAFMLILAVGTEVTIDSLKVIAGFKSKPTAMDTINRLKDWLPGSLQEMGAGASAVSQLKLTLDAMAGHMKQVDKATEAVQTIDQWLPDYLKNLSVDRLENLLSANLPTLKTDLEKRVGVENTRVALGWLRGALATLRVTSVKDLSRQARDLVQDLEDLKDPQKVADAIETSLQKVLPENLADLAQDSRKFLQEALPRLIEELKKAGIDPKSDLDHQDVLDHVQTWLTGTLTYLEANSSNTYTAALTALMQTVEDQRDNIHSWIGKLVRRFFRWLKRVLPLDSNPQDSKLRAWLRRFFKDILDRIDRYRSGEHVIPPLNPSNLARVLLERDSEHRQEELSRLRWLRLISVVVGIALAVMLKVDVGDLLKPLISADLHDVLAGPLCEVDNARAWCAGITSIPWVKGFLSLASIGMLLSGLAASAGSAFWHDLLDRLQSAKKATGEVRDLIEQIRALEQGK